MKTLTLFELMKKINERKRLPLVIKLYNKIYKIEMYNYDSIDYITENGEYLIDEILKHTNILSNLIDIEIEIVRL